jgi:hypothetical protein
MVVAAFEVVTHQSAVGLRGGLWPVSPHVRQNPRNLKGRLIDKDNKCLVAHPMAGLCERCLSCAIALRTYCMHESMVFYNKSKNILFLIAQH